MESKLAVVDENVLPEQTKRPIRLFVSKAAVWDIRGSPQCWPSVEANAWISLPAWTNLRWTGKVTVPTAVWVGLPLALVWFIGGFLLYCTLFALAGSMVSRLEDAQGATMPVTMVLLVAYMAVFTVGQVPDSTAARVLSVLPPFAPLMMPLRIVTGSASVLEIVLAAVLLMAAIYGMLRLVSAVYMRTLLHRGSRLTWRQAIALRG